MALLRRTSRSSLHTRVSPDVVSYTTVLRVCVKAEQWLRALDLLRDMSDSLVVPNLVTYNTMIDPITREGGWQALLTLFEELWSKSLPPDLQLLNTSISACARNSTWPISLLLFNQVTKPSPPEKLGLQDGRLIPATPDSYSFNAVISACAYGAAWQAAVELVLQASLQGLPDSSLILTAASSACSLGFKWQLGLELAQQARSAVPTGDKQGAFVSLGATLKACERGAHWALACYTAQAALEAGLVDASASCAAVSACEKSQQWQHSIALAHSLTTNCAKPSALLCGAVISSCEYSQNWDLALRMLHSRAFGGGAQLFRELASTARAAGATMPFAAAMSCCSKAGRWELVLHLWAWLQSTGTRSLVANAAAMEACSKGRQWQQAEFLLSHGTVEAETAGLESVLFALDLCGHAARTVRWRSKSRPAPMLAANHVSPSCRSGEALAWHNRTCAALTAGIEAHAHRVARKLPRSRHAVLQLLVHARHMLAGICTQVRCQLPPFAGSTRIRQKRRYARRLPKLSYLFGLEHCRLRRCHWPARRGGALHEVLAGTLAGLQPSPTQLANDNLRLALKSPVSTQRPPPVSPRLFTSCSFPSSLFRSCLANGSFKLVLAGVWRWEIISPLRVTRLQQGRGHCSMNSCLLDEIGASVFQNYTSSLPGKQGTTIRSHNYLPREATLCCASPRATTVSALSRPSQWRASRAQRNSWGTV